MGINDELALVSPEEKLVTAGLPLFLLLSLLCGGGGGGRATVFLPCCSQCPLSLIKTL